MGRKLIHPSMGAKAQPAALERAIRSNVLVVEPDSLMRWSLVTYLSRWYRVFPADSAPSAEQTLRTQRIAAMVMSEELGLAECESLAVELRRNSPSARIVRVITSVREGASADTACLEKPFELSRLLDLLKERTPAA